MSLPTPIISDRGRGPEIEGTRVTVYDVLDYHKHGWHHSIIASILDISSAEVLAAIAYIEAHRDEVMRRYQQMLDRHARGNSAQALANLDQSHARLLARIEERNRLKVAGGSDARAAG